MGPKPPPKARGKRAKLTKWIEATNPRLIGEDEFEELRRIMAPISDSYLRKLLRDSGVGLAPMVEGVRQANFDELERSLLAMLREYEQGGHARRAAVRQLVMTAKDHARWAARKTETSGEKEEMSLWLLTWLENPPLFPEWVKLRRARLGSNAATAETRPNPA
jgi:hypothetical protein